MNVEKRLIIIIEKLGEKYPNPTCALNHRDPLQLLIATILSAQCTDKRVNQVTPPLFQKYPTATAFAKSSPPELEEMIRSTGFFRNKAKNIKGCCEMLCEKHGGRVPNDMDQLLALPGVARKTANVVMGNAFGIASGIVVDTHVRRVSNRLGLTKQIQPEKIETDLIKIIPKAEWINFSHWLIFHGRQTCKARNPLCDDCLLLHICPREGVE